MSTKKEVPPRTFVCVKDDKSTVLVSVRIPTKAEIEAGDMEYSAQFNNAILHKLPTQTALLRRLRENGIIEPAVEEEIGQLNQDRRVLLKRVKDDKFPDDAAKDACKAEIVVNESRLGVLNNDIESFFEHTADIKAAQSQRNFAIACVTEFADGAKKGERLWPSVDDLLSEEDVAMLNRCVYEYVTLVNGQEGDWDNLIKPKLADEKKAEVDANASAVVLAAAAPVIEAISSVPPAPPTEPGAPAAVIEVAPPAPLV